MRYRELKVGMLITGKSNNGYFITNNKSVCKVLTLRGLDELICVEVMYSPDEKLIGSKWQVDYKRFVKYDKLFPIVNDINADDEVDDVRDFQIGDYVIGNNLNKYPITKRGQICKVVGVCKEDEIRICLVNPITYRAGLDKFIVKKKYFDLYKKYRGLFGSKILDGTIKVADNKCVLPCQINTESPCYKQIVKEFMDNGLIKKGE